MHGFVETVGFGSVITRAIYGASPAIPIVVASAVLVIIHRAVAMLTARFPAVERLVKGETQLLYHDGHHDVREVRLETSGELSVID